MNRKFKIINGWRVRLYPHMASGKYRAYVRRAAGNIRPKPSPRKPSVKKPNGPSKE